MRIYSDERDFICCKSTYFFIVKIGFSFSVNVYVFIPMMLFYG